MPFLRKSTQAKFLPPAVQLNDRVPSYMVPPGNVGKPYRSDWDTQRAVEFGLQANIWVMRCVNLYANTQARLPMIMRQGNPIDGPYVDHPILDLFNFQSSLYESALIFRKRISQVLLLNKQGCMIEVIYNRMGTPAALYILPPGFTWPVPSETTFCSAFRVQFPGKCLAAGTGIITKRGVIPIEEVVVGDEVVTHLGRWRRVTGCSNRDLRAAESMVALSATGLGSLTCTDDHKIWAATYTYNKGNSRHAAGIGRSATHGWEPNGHLGGRHLVGTDWVPAGEIVARKGHSSRLHALTLPVLSDESAPSLDIRPFLPRSGKFPYREVDGMLVSAHRLARPVPAEVKLDRTFGRLVGMYLAEGSVARGAEVQWAFHRDETHLHEEVRRSLNEIFGVDVTIGFPADKKVAKVHAYSKALGALLACGEATTKRMPEWAWSGGPEFMDGVLSGWIDGDGHTRRRHGSTEVAVTTASYDLAWHMRLVAISCGKRPTIATRPPRKNAWGKDGMCGLSYELSWSEDHDDHVAVPQGMPTYRLDGGTLTFPVTTASPSDYSDAVYDLTIEDDHSFLTTGGLVHNSWVDVPAENVIWIREPHPTDPYSGQTPLEAAGLSIETDYYQRLYRRNFLLNDGRPGGVLMIKGQIDDWAALQLRQRFYGTQGWGAQGAGRVTVMSADDAQYVDMSQTARDSQYVEGAQLTKTEILLAMGVPESMIGNASARTFANASAEEYQWWTTSMLNHLDTIAKAFDALDPDPKLFLGFDLSRVSALQLPEQEEAKLMLQEVQQGPRSYDEYRIKRGLMPVGGGAAKLRAPATAVEVADTTAALVPDWEQNPNAFQPSLVMTGLPAAPETKALPAAAEDEVEVAVYPHPAVAANLARQWGCAPESVRLVLFKAGSVGDWQPLDLADLERVVGEFCADEAPLIASITAASDFVITPGEAKGLAPSVNVVASKALLEMRDRLMARLIGEGLRPSISPAA